MNDYRPQARADGLIVEEIDGEVLVYDVERDRAHCLNGPAATIWTLCDGTLTVSDLGEIVGPDAKDGAQVAVLALGQLGRRHLLAEPLPSGINRIDRRALLRKAAAAGAVALTIPLIKSIVAPTAAMAASCFPTGHPCTPSGTPCCSGTCLGGSPAVCA